MICNIHEYKKMGCHGKVEVNEEHDTLAFIVSLILVKSCEIGCCSKQKSSNVKSSARSKMVMNKGWLLTHFRETSWVHKLFSCGSFVRVVSLRWNIVWDCSVVHKRAMIYPWVTR